MVCSIILLIYIYPRKENLCLHNGLYMSNQSQKQKTRNNSKNIIRKVDKQIVVYLYNGILILKGEELLSKYHHKEILPGTKDNIG